MVWQSGPEKMLFVSLIYHRQIKEEVRCLEKRRCHMARLQAGSHDKCAIWRVCKPSRMTNAPYGVIASRLAGQMYPAQSDIPYLCVVGAQKLVCSGSHGHEMRFALSAFPVNERMHWLVCRGLLSVGIDHLIPCFQQIRGIPLCWRIAMSLMPADRFLTGSMPMKATDALRRGQRRAPPKFTP